MQRDRFIRARARTHLPSACFGNSRSLNYATTAGVASSRKGGAGERERKGTEVEEGDIGSLATLRALLQRVLARVGRGGKSRGTGRQREIASRRALRYALREP